MACFLRNIKSLENKNLDLSQHNDQKQDTMHSYAEFQGAKRWELLNAWSSFSKLKYASVQTTRVDRLPGGISMYATI